jgi:hypothetical protein
VTVYGSAKARQAKLGIHHEDHLHIVEHLRTSRY